MTAHELIRFQYARIDRPGLINHCAQKKLRRLPREHFVDEVTEEFDGQLPEDAAILRSHRG
jgi:hypothetical protein